jgi:coenzyme A diphosphatase NUDT7
MPPPELFAHCCLKYREAFEEVALPIDCPDIHTIGCLEPLFSSSRMVVTPVVAVLTDLTVLDGLKASAGEVAKIFDHPLQALLDPRLAKDEPLVHKATENWPYDPEFHVSHLSECR